MKREEAGRILEVTRVLALSADEDRLDLTIDEIDALEVAIKALNQPEIIRCRDCIYGDSEGLMQIGDKFFAMYRCERSNNLEKGMSYCGHAIRREEGEQCQPKE